MKVIKYFVVWVLLLCLFVQVFFLFGNFTSNGGLFFDQSQKLPKILYLFLQWDGGNYFEIAKNGYSRPELFAFFPLYPGLISVLGEIIPLELAGLVISNLSFFGFLMVSQKYLRTYYPGINQNVFFFSLFLFPSTFILSFYYPESLLLLLTLVSVSLLRSKAYFPSAVFASFSAITRPQGVVFVMAFVWFILFRTSERLISKIALVSVSIFPILTYLFIQSRYTNNLLAPIQAQTYWQRFTFPKITLQFDYLGLLALANLSTLIFVLWLFWHYKKHLDIFAKLFFASSIFLPIISGSLDGFPRYLLSSFPIFILLAHMLQTKPHKIILFSLLALLQALCLGLFVSGRWIF